MYIISTQSPHGGTFFGDSEVYSYDVVDKALIQIEFRSFIPFEDSHEEGISDTWLLQIGKNYSKYYTLIHHKLDSCQFCPFEGLSTINPVFVYECFYTNIATRTVTYTNRLVQDDFLYEDQLPQIEWVIDNDSTKVICGMTCHKASCTFRGRKYESWFTESIPSQCGPWKLGGLPGVILMAKDLESNTLFEATGIRGSIADILIANYPYIKVSREKYRELLDQRLEKPSSFSVAHGNRYPQMKITAKGPEKPQRKICILENDL